MYSTFLIKVSLSYNLFILFNISLLPDCKGICKCLAMISLFFIKSIIPSVISFISILDNLILSIPFILTSSLNKDSRLVCFSIPYLPV